VLDGWLIHQSDTADIPAVKVAAVPLLMTSVEATAAMASAALELIP
jgi:LPPG:FO 2-phospho-L-lactate transferase